MRTKKVDRKVRDTHVRHEHLVPKTFTERINNSPERVMECLAPWMFYEPRHRWEAVCEKGDILFYCEAVEEDREFRKGRTLHDDSNGATTS